MNLDPHLLARAAPAGSLRWHALLYAPPCARPGLAAVLAFEAELRTASSADQDHTVAHARLQWWRAEVDRLRGGRPEHPVTRALHAIDGSHDWTLLHEAIAGADLDMSCLTYASDQEFAAYLFRTCGALHCVAAALAAPRAEPDEVRRFGSAIGRLVRTAEIIRDVGHDSRHGRVYVPLDRLGRHGIDVPALQARHLDASARACLRELAGNARAEWSAAAAATTDSLRGAGTGQRVLAGLHLALIDEIERRDYDVGLARHEVGPWRKLWSAWRSARN